MSDNWIVQNLENALETWNEKLAEIWQLITQSPENFKGGTIWNVIVGIHGAVQAIGLGPQGMGGKYSVMGVHIENTARHPSAIGVAVNVGCWSHRRGHIIFDKDLNYTIDTHSGVTL